MLKSYEKFAGATAVSIVITDDLSIARLALKNGFIETGDVSASNDFSDLSEAEVTPEQVASAEPTGEVDAVEKKVRKSKKVAAKA